MSCDVSCWASRSAPLLLQRVCGTWLGQSLVARAVLSALAGLIPWRDLRHTRPHPQTTTDDSTVFQIVRICVVRQLFVEPMFSGPVCAWSTFLIFRLIPSGSGIRLCAGPFGLSAHVSELKNIGPSGGILLSSPSFVFFGIINSGSFKRHSVASSTCPAAVAAR